MSAPGSGKVYVASGDSTKYLELNNEPYIEVYNVHCTNRGMTFLVAVPSSGPSGLYRILPDGNYNLEAVSSFNNMGVSEIASNVEGDVFIASGTTLYKSEDDGANWSTVGTLPQEGYLTTLSVAPDQYLYAGFSGDVIYRSTKPTAESNFVLGKVWLDNNGDCLYNAGETYQTSVGVTATGNGAYASYSGYNGNFTLSAPEIEANYPSQAQISALISSISDNCTATGSLVKTVSPASFTCSNIGANTITVIVTDASGNSSTCTTTLTVLAAPTNITVNDKTLVEGSPSGNNTLIFNVNRSHAGCPTTVNYATADGTATTTDLDYLAATGTLTIPFGIAVGQISVTTKKDIKVEMTEQFSLNICNVINGTITDPTGLATLTNDDVVVIQIANFGTGETNSGLKTMNFNATLTKPVDVPVTFNYTTSNGTATLADNDYVACPSCLATIPAGALSMMFSILNM